MKRRGRKRKKLHLRPIMALILSVFIMVGPYYFWTHQQDAPPKETPKEAESWTGVITFWDYPRLDQTTGSSYGWMRERIKAFERANPGVFIDFEGMTWEQGPEKLSVAITHGTLPDILPLGTNYALLDQGILVPLSDHLPADFWGSFEAKALSAVTYQNKVWAMPWMMSTYGMILNEDRFQQAGVALPENGQWTYEEFVEKLKALTHIQEGRGKTSYYGLNSFIQADYYNLWGIILSDGAQLFDERMNYAFNDHRAISGVQKLLDLKFTHGITPRDFGENTSNQAWTTFYKDKNVAVIPTGTWSLNVLKKLQEEGKGFAYSVASYPTGALGKPVILGNMVGSYGITTQEDPAKLKMVLKFLTFLVEEQNQLQLNRLGMFPVKKGLESMYAEDPLMLKYYENLENTILVPPHPQWGEIDKIIQGELQKGIRGEKTAQQVVQDAAAQVTQLLGQ